MTGATSPVLVRSFDVFDTVLTRAVGAPDAVLPLVTQAAAERGLSGQVPPSALASTRSRVEQELVVLWRRPPTLVEVHTEVARRLGLPHESAVLLVAAEEDVERELSRLVPGADEMLGKARAETPDGALVFVSDTPHRPALLQELLTAVGVWRDGDRLYCSAALGASKAEGRLFDIVAGDLGVAAEQILHVGDDLRSDVAAAQVQGWTSRLRGRGRLNRYEHLWEQESAATDGLTSWLAGASRLARLEAQQRGTPTGIAVVAAGVVAPLLVGHALWLAAEVRRTGLTRLYFVARDGEVMLDVARHVLGRLTPEVECRYLYGSRQAWEFAGLATAPDRLAGWVTVQKGITARAVLARVAMTPEEAASLGLPALAGGADAPLSEADRQALAAFLQAPEIAATVRRRAEQAADVAGDYLEQEGFGDPAPSALVDLGWRGSTARAFDVLLTARGLPAVRHLFLGLTADAAAVRASAPGTDLVGWLFDLSTRQGIPAAATTAGLVTALESFCAGTEGRCLGYRAEAGTVSPILASAQNTPVLQWGLDDLRRTVLDVVEMVTPRLREQHLHVDLAAPVGATLRMFWTRPAPDEVASWGAFPYEDETWPPYNPLAQRIATLDVLRRFARGDRNLRRVQSWRAGSAQVSAQPWRALLLAKEWEARTGVPYRRIPRRLKLELAARLSQR